MAAARRDALLDAARAALAAPAGSSAALHAGATAPDARLVLVRLLAQRVEPALAALQRARAAWRTLAWGLPAAAPRIWKT
jgi:urease accessory protein